MQLRIFLLLIALLGLAQSQISFVDKNSEKIEFASFNFGKVPYGKTIINIVNTTDVEYNVCVEYESHIVVSPIWIIDRGICVPDVAAIQAQAKGVKLLIMVNNADEDINNIHFSNYIDHQKIDIMAVIVKKSDGEKLKNFILERQRYDPKNQQRMIVHFPELRKQPKVLVEYWFSSIDHETYYFFEHFKQILQEIGPSLIEFYPHVILHQDSYSKFIKFTKENEKCVSAGRYCSFDPDGSGPLTSRDQIMQNLRSLCMFHYNQDQFLEYMIQIDRQCILGNNNGLADNFQDCVAGVKDQVMNFTSETPLGQEDKVEACIDISFNHKNPYIADNTILSAEFEKYNEYQINQWPSLYINQQPVSGDLAIYDVILIAICAGLQDSKQHSVCRYYVEGQVSEHAPAISPSTLVVIIVLFALVLIILLLIYLKRVFSRENKDQLKRQVQSEMEKYVQLQSDQK